MNLKKGAPLLAEELNKMERLSLSLCSFHGIPRTVCAGVLSGQKNESPPPHTHTHTEREETVREGACALNAAFSIENPLLLA